MKDEYCIYSDRIFPYAETNMEHILPLSLGGANAFMIRVHKDTNSTLGHHVDGRLTKDYLISSLRRHKNLRGHRNYPPKTILKKATVNDTNQPIQLVLEGKDKHFYDPIKKEIIPNIEMVGVSLNMRLKIDKYARPLFVAKTILSGCYFAFGETFKKHADHESLRKLMNFKLSETEKSIKNLPLTIHDPLFGQEVIKPSIPHMLTKIIEAVNCSCVVILYYNDVMVGSIGIAGTYIGSISFPVNLSKFPNSDKFESGHIMGIQNGELKRSSVKFLVNKCFSKPNL